MTDPTSDLTSSGSGDSLPQSESELASRAVSGDLEAAESLAALTYRRVFAAQVKFTGGDVDLAADLTQETYRKAWAAIRRFRGSSSFSTWLYRIAYNVYLTHVSRPRPLSPLDEEQVANIVEDSPSQEETVAVSRQAARLRRAVLALPEELRFAVTARYWGDLPVREIAAHEGLSGVGIRKRLLRAYSRLAEDLGTIEDVG
jgi:RNA polymerase sigma-70 factor (ECF subfamily)